MSARRAGRPGGLDEARELCALVASLSEAGDALTVDAVSSKLAVPTERARQLISLVLELTAGDELRLPLVEDERGEEVTLVFSGGVRGRRLRLTERETVAIAAALEHLGVNESDPLRRRIEGSLSDAQASRDVIERVAALLSLDEGGTAGGSSLIACALACARRHELGFIYRKAGGSTQERRLVAPQRMRHEEGTWYLDAFDLDRNEGRRFRVDRMEQVEDRGPTRVCPTGDLEAGGRPVEVTFLDERYLSLLPWHKATVVGRDDEGHVRVSVPYFGGTWLPRMLAACGGAARTADEEISELTRRYARDELRAGAEG